MGDGVEEKKGNLFSRFLEMPTESGWRFNTIGLTGLVFGIFGWIIGWRTGGTPLNSISLGLGISMLFAPYFIVPRTKTNRMWQGLAGGALAGLITVVLLLSVAWHSYWPLRVDLVMTYGTSALGTLGVSWLMSVFANWTDKRKAKMDAENVAKEKKEVLVGRPKRRKSSAKQEPTQRVRIHRYNKKKKR